MEEKGEKELQVEEESKKKKNQCVDFIIFKLKKN